MFRLIHEVTESVVLAPDPLGEAVNARGGGNTASMLAHLYGHHEIVYMLEMEAQRQERQVLDRSAMAIAEQLAAGLSFGRLQFS